jgi:hypothetical protein
MRFRFAGATAAEAGLGSKKLLPNTPPNKGRAESLFNNFLLVIIDIGLKAFD